MTNALSPTNDAIPYHELGNASAMNGASRVGINGNPVPVPSAPHNRTSSSPFPAMQRGYSGMDPAAAAQAAAFTGPRSPPKAKNTSHVPCKFYPYGTCQAGAACQFSHDLDPMTQNAPCKYFAKGSCKFGQGCALAHILPDGRVINRPPRGGQPFAYARRTHIPQTLPPGPPSLLSMQAHDMSAQQDFPYTGLGADDLLEPRYHQQTPTLGLPQDSLLPGEPISAFGSLPNDSRMGASPSNRGLSVLDAPLPSSFDSQGFSHAARHGPFAASVPHRFGFESPPSSLPNKPFPGSIQFRGLHGSAFGDSANLDRVLHGAGSSPPSFDEPLSFSKRPLHSERLYSERGLARGSRMGMMSASLGTRPSLFQQDQSSSDLGESDDEGIGEDLLPSSLHELLPQDKPRRFSARNLPEDDANPTLLSAQRRAISTGYNPQDSKIGSLSPHSASPSRYNALFTSRSLSKADSDSNSPSAFGHVGSPLRPSALRSSSLAAISASAGSDLGQYAVGSPPRQASMSMLTQELQRTRLNEQAKSPGVSRSLSSNSNPTRASLIERGMSSSSLGRETIEEEQGLFSMEEEDGEPSTGMNFASKNGKNAAFGMTPGKSEATLGPIGTK